MEALADAEPLEALADAEPLEALADAEPLEALADAEPLEALADAEPLVRGHAAWVSSDCWRFMSGELPKSAKAGLDWQLTGRRADPPPR
jgi:hypothetical protein